MKMRFNKLSKFWHQVSSFITTLWADVNYKSLTHVEPTSHFTYGIAAIMKWRKTNGIYFVVFPKQYI